jgi:hypothetical protein
MISRFISRLFYGSLVMLGVVVCVFFIPGIRDPSRLIMGQRADAGTFKISEGISTWTSRNGNNLCIT